MLLLNIKNCNNFFIIRQILHEFKLLNEAFLCRINLIVNFGDELFSIIFLWL